MAKNIKETKLTEFIPDPNNLNKGTERGRGMLERSLTDLGLGRSILVDKHNVVIAGNKTLEAAAENGFDDAIVVETNGEKLVVVKRTDLDLDADEKAKQLAIADNRVAELDLSWDVDALIELEETVDLSMYFSDTELSNLASASNDEDEVDYEDMWQGMPTFEQSDALGVKSIKVNFMTHEAIAEFAQLIGQKVTERTKFINFPYQEADDVLAHRCKDES